ncbi:helix-turn-helix domain-containing protein [Aerococcus sp. 1KP-2016]|uniref:helix-turn-helix domain-containing protein n=1 Tax=Aerococcus sp. 1KP-2016 TaxID=1981982 RepID=UPI001314640C|nr:helix-turn-helix domain-containing protein [Aerococcus sp. 1KP-2016]
MENLLTTTEQRRFDFLELLVRQGGWRKITEIAEDLGVSERVLRKDIAYFQEFFDMVKIDQSSRGIRIILPHNVGMFSLSKKFLEYSDYYQMLEYIFFSGKQSVEELANNIFKSVSTVYRMIKIINQKFKHYDIYISSNPVEIIGNEKNIRSYFYQYFTSKYNHKNFPFQDLDDSVFIELLQPLRDHFDILYGFSDFNNFKISTYLELIRTSGGHTVKITSSRLNEFSYLKDLISNTALITTLESTFKTKFDEQLWLQIYYSLIEFNFLFDTTCLREDKSLSKNTSYQFIQLITGITNIQRTFHLELINTNELILAIMNAINLVNYRPFTISILYDKNKNFIEDVQKIAPQFVDAINQLLIKHFKTFDMFLDETEKYVVVYVVISQWKNLMPQLLKEAYPVTIGVFSIQSDNSAEMISDVLRLHLPQSVIISPCQLMNPDIHFLLQNKMDIIITDFPTKVQSSRLIYIENMPNKQDFENIYYAFNEVTSERITSDRKTIE